MSSAHRKIAMKNTVATECKTANAQVGTLAGLKAWNLSKNRMAPSVAPAW